MSIRNWSFVQWSQDTWLGMRDTSGMYTRRGRTVRTLIKLTGMTNACAILQTLQSKYLTTSYIYVFSFCFITSFMWLLQNIKSDGQLVTFYYLISCCKREKWNVNFNINDTCLDVLTAWRLHISICIKYTNRMRLKFSVSLYYIDKQKIILDVTVK